MKYERKRVQQGHIIYRKVWVCLLQTILHCCCVSTTSVQNGPFNPGYILTNFITPREIGGCPNRLVAHTIVCGVCGVCVCAGPLPRSHNTSKIHLASCLPIIPSNTRWTMVVNLLARGQHVVHQHPYTVSDTRQSITRY